MTDAAALLLRFGACHEAREWVADRDPETAWAECPRGDWLLWIAARIGVDRRLVVRAACACAREALVHVPEGEDRPRIAIETAEAWTRGEATLADVRATANAAADAYAAYAAASATDASASASAAADAVYAAANAAAHANAAADAYADAYASATTTAAAAAAYGYGYADAAARAASLQRSADLVRSVIAWADIHESSQT